MDLNFSLTELRSAASTLLKQLSPGAVVAFSGEMGAGKTSFIHGICEEMGIKDAVTSPTFSIINEYRAGGKPVYHIDLYRLNNNEEAVAAGIEDCLYSGNTCFVEWPEKAPGIFPPETVYARISIIDVNTRKLEINL